MARRSLRGHIEICRNCGTIFIARVWNQLDCSLRCHHAWINRQRKRERAENRAREERFARRWRDRINEELKNYAW